MQRWLESIVEEKVLLAEDEKEWPQLLGSIKPMACPPLCRVQALSAYVLYHIFLNKSTSYTDVFCYVFLFMQVDIIVTK